MGLLVFVCIFVIVLVWSQLLVSLVHCTVVIHFKVIAGFVALALYLSFCKTTWSVDVLTGRLTCSWSVSQLFAMQHALLVSGVREDVVAL
jgi:hypothetical protein